MVEHFVYNVRTLERMGVSAVIIEDKTGLKEKFLIWYRSRTDTGQYREFYE